MRGPGTSPLAMPSRRAKIGSLSSPTSATVVKPALEGDQRVKRAVERQVARPSCVTASILRSGPAG